MTSTAIARPHHIEFHRITSYDKWEELRRKVSLESVVDLPIDEIRGRIEKLYAYVDSNREYFDVKTEPVSDDILEDHFKPHFTYLDELVFERVLTPRDAVKVAELVYIYDCVLPHLAEDIIAPKDNPELKITVLVIPDELYDWMVKLDCLWFKLLFRRVLDRNLLRYLEERKMEFIKRALELKVFLPVPPKDVHELDLEKLWFRRHRVDWKLVHDYVYRKVSSLLHEQAGIHI